MMRSYIVLAVLVLSSVTFAYDPNSEPNMMLFYQFEQSVTTDSQGQYNDGYTNGGIVWVEDAPLQLSLNGQGTRSVNLSASDAWIAIPGTEDDFNLQSMTVAVWMKGEPLRPWSTIVSKFGENNLGWQFRRGGNTPANLAMTLRGVNNADGNTNTVPELEQGVWRHYAATHDATTGETNYYVDGKLFQTITGRTGTVAATTSPLAIGVRIREDGSIDTPAQIPGLDDVRVYGRVLSASEIAALCPPPAKRAYVTLPVDGYIGMIDYPNASIEWDSPASGAVAGYNVWIKKDGDPNWVQAVAMTAAASVTFPVGMEQNTAYWARVDVVDPTGFIIAGDPVSWYSSALPTITKDPVTPKDPFKAGSNPAFYCGATDPLGAELTYQWYVNGKAVPGTNDPKFVWYDIKPKDHNSEVYCEISSVNGSDVSNTALALVEGCIAQFTFDSMVDHDPNHYDPNFPNIPIGMESRYGYDCTLAGDMTGLSNTTGPDGSNALALNGAVNAALVSNFKPDANLHFRDYADRAYITLSMWMKGFPANDCYIAGMEGGGRGYGFRKIGTTLSWTTRDHDKDGDMPVDYTSYSNDGKWHFITAYFGPNNYRSSGNEGRMDKALYIDGVLVSVKDGDFNRPGIGVNYDPMLFAIGCHAADAASRGEFAGGPNFAIDDLRVYNYALDTGEIAYLATHPGASPECIGIDGDVNGDCTVDLDDLVIEAQNWLVTK